MSLTPRDRRVALAVALSGWCGLQALTMVVAALVSEGTHLALGFFATGLFTAGLAGASWWAWRRVGPREAPGTLEPPGPAEPPARHHGFDGTVDPPRRW